LYQNNDRRAGGLGRKSRVSRFGALRRNKNPTIEKNISTRKLNRNLTDCLVSELDKVNRSQIDIKRKTYDIRNWKRKHLFLDLSSTNTDTLVTWLYQCVETRSMEVF
jgi:hypothetical protein